MSPDRLEALRRKYRDAGGGDSEDPLFRAVADAQFSEGDRRKWPFSGAATFLGADYRPDAPALPDFGGLDCALIGVPMDLGVTNRAGARLGPRAVRAVERIGPIEHALRIAPATTMRMADVGDVPFQSRFSLERCHADIEAYFDRVVAAGVVPLAVGGDHSITLSILRALGRHRPVGMVHIDVQNKEQVIAQGQKIYVPLAPRDPRSLMQGDYMALNFAFPQEVRDALNKGDTLGTSRHALVVAVLDERGVATVRRLAQSNEALSAGERLLPLKRLKDDWVLVTDAFYFPEGQGTPFARARFGEFRVLPDGRALLVGLADEHLQALLAAPNPPAR